MNIYILPNIAIKAFKSNFYKLEKIDLEIKFETSLILENIRNNAIIKGAYPIRSKSQK